MTPRERARVEAQIHSLQYARSTLDADDWRELARLYRALGRHEDALRSLELGLGAAPDLEVLEDMAGDAQGGGPRATAYGLASAFRREDRLAHRNGVRASRRARRREAVHDEVRGLVRAHGLPRRTYALLCGLLEVPPEEWDRPAPARRGAPRVRGPAPSFARFGSGGAPPARQRPVLGSLRRLALELEGLPGALCRLCLAIALQHSGRPASAHQLARVAAGGDALSDPQAEGCRRIALGATRLALGSVADDAGDAARLQVRDGLRPLVEAVIAGDPSAPRRVVSALGDAGRATGVQAPGAVSPLGETVRESLGDLQDAAPADQIRVLGEAAADLRRLGCAEEATRLLRRALHTGALALPLAELAVEGLCRLGAEPLAEDARSLDRAEAGDSSHTYTELSVRALTYLGAVGHGPRRRSSDPSLPPFVREVLVLADGLASWAAGDARAGEALVSGLAALPEAALSPLQRMRVALRYCDLLPWAGLRREDARRALDVLQSLADAPADDYVRGELLAGRVRAVLACTPPHVERSDAVARVQAVLRQVGAAAEESAPLAEAAGEAVVALAGLEPGDAELQARKLIGASYALGRGCALRGHGYFGVRLGLVAAGVCTEPEELERQLARLRRRDLNGLDRVELLGLVLDRIEAFAGTSGDRLARAGAVATRLRRLVASGQVEEDHVPPLVDRLAAVATSS